MVSIDLNCDLGEGAGNDAQLMPYLSSCNIACGGHVGNEASMRASLQLAKELGVRCGAHPSFPDKQHFGRQIMAISPDILLKEIVRQVSALRTIAREEGLVLHHIKPHGALYNLAASDAGTATTIIKAFLHFPEKLLLYAPYGSEVAQQAIEQGIGLMYEAFADRNYTRDLQLVSRSEPNALLHTPEAIEKHVLRIILQKKVLTISGEELPLEADTLCVHGDNPKALAIIKHLKATFQEKGIYCA